MGDMKIIFFGSSDFSVPILQVLVGSSHNISLVVTSESQRQGRGQRQKISVVQEKAKHLNLKTQTPSNLNHSTFLQAIKDLSVDCFVVASYGKMLPTALLEIPKRYSLNVHPSLLPKYRGASPIVSQILNGETESGITIATITKKLDAGDIVAQQSFPIPAECDAITLEELLSKKSGAVLLTALETIEKRKETCTKQNEVNASYVRKLDKEMGKINWSLPANRVHNQVRAFIRWPSTFTFLNKKRVKIIKTETALSVRGKFAPGTITKIESNGPLWVQTGKGNLRILSLQPESGKVMSPHAFVIGHHVEVGQSFS